MELEEAIKKLNEIKEEYNRFDGLKEYVEAMDFMLNRITKQEKMIDIIIKHICDIIDNDDNASLLPFYNSDDNIEEKVRQYFEKKVEE